MWSASSAGSEPHSGASERRDRAGRDRPSGVATQAARTARNGTDRRSREALVWLEPPVSMPRSRLRVLAYDPRLPVPDWLTEALAASRRNAEPGLPL